MFRGKKTISVPLPPNVTVDMVYKAAELKGVSVEGELRRIRENRGVSE